MIEDDITDISEIKNIEKSVILSSTVRMTIMLLLRRHKEVKLSDLRKLIKETSGNLDYHIKQLEKENLVLRKPGFFNKRILNVLQITPEGKKRLNNDITLLQSYFNKLTKENGENIDNSD